MYPSKCVACTAFVTNNKNDDRETEKESFFLFVDHALSVAWGKIDGKLEKEIAGTLTFSSSPLIGSFLVCLKLCRLFLE